VPHVACFDTAFHAGRAELTTRLPLPEGYEARGYRRYGFHGLNYEHVVRALPQATGEPLPARLIIAHLGSGCSMCAVRDGRSVETTMGYSTADGLVMATRTGAIDPGVLVALLRDEALSLDALEDLLYRRSGLLGLSGETADMRKLLASGSPAARLAVDIFCYQAARHAASLAVALGGVDAIVFTGGIGENSGEIRSRIMARLGFLGVGTQAVHVVPADEELAMARHVRSLLGG
jgi:acetate kinase